MKLNTNGVMMSILILIFMILTCHTMNYLYPKKRIQIINPNIKGNCSTYSNCSGKGPDTCNCSGKGTDKSNYDSNTTNELNTFINIPKNTNYNKIYYTNQNEKQLCDEHAKLPCKKTCSDDDYSLSDSELAFLYKFAYEEAGREILMRTIRGEDGFEY